MTPSFAGALVGTVRRAARRALATPFNSALTVGVGALGVALVVPLLQWALLDATWSGTAAACRARSGACWAFVGHKLPFILFGLYPAAERWRAASALAVLIGLIALTGMPGRWNRWLPIVWGAGLTLACLLLRGGGGLALVPTQAWGGLPVTLLLTAAGLAVGFPWAVLLALARRSRYRGPRALATAFVEGVRGVPLIAVLYLAVLILPLGLPPSLTPPKLVLAGAGIAAFAAAYLCEAVRAGLQMVPRSRLDAALALGLGRWQALGLVILPEALRIVIPSFVSIAVGFFQDTSLIVIVGLFDLLNTARLAALDPEWLGFSTEGFVFVGALYFAGSALLSRYGRWLERRMARAGTRV